jgi:hypothetical protein
MAATPPFAGGSTGAGGGGGGGGGGTVQQLGGPQHPPLNDLISTVAGQVAPFVGGSHQLNAGLYRYSKGQGRGFQFMAGFTRHRFERPGAVAVTLLGGIQNADNETTTTIKSRRPPWPVTTYEQLIELLYLVPLGDHQHEHFIVFWVGGGDKAFPVTVRANELPVGHKLEVIDEVFSGMSFCQMIASKNIPRDYEEFSEEIARIVCMMVGETKVPTSNEPANAKEFKKR